MLIVVVKYILRCFVANSLLSQFTQFFRKKQFWLKYCLCKKCLFPCLQSTPLLYRDLLIITLKTIGIGIFLNLNSFAQQSDYHNLNKKSYLKTHFLQWLLYTLMAVYLTTAAKLVSANKGHKGLESTVNLTQIYATDFY